MDSSLPIDTLALEAQPASRDADVQAVVEAARRGDRGAFDELYRRYRRLVHGILLTRVPRADAEDVLQDVFLQAWRQLPALRTSAAFGGWLVSMTRHRAIDHLRTRPAQETLVDVGRPASADDNARAAQALDAIRSLPEAYREPLMLRLVEGLTGPEIADQTGMTPGSVRVNLCRGMKLLRARLDHGDRHVG